jgi:hypothetical protein
MPAGGASDSGLTRGSFQHYGKTMKASPIQHQHHDVGTYYVSSTFTAEIWLFAQRTSETIRLLLGLLLLKDNKVTLCCEHMNKTRDLCI